MTPADLPPPIPGLEGPFRYKTGFVLYWDPKEGQYYDRGRDLYLSTEEVEGVIGNPAPAQISDGRLRQILREARKNEHYRTRALAKVAVQGYGGLDESAPSWAYEFSRTKEHPHVGAKRILAEIDSGTASTWELEQILAGMERADNPIPNRGPLTRSKKWITRPGKLGGKGFLSRPLAAQHRILAHCVSEYGYRSCLGSVMVLERIHRTEAKFGPRLRHLREWLVGEFGGPGSFGPRSNPKITLTKSEIRELRSEAAQARLAEAMGFDDVYEWREWKAENKREREAARKTNPSEPFVLLPELTGCEACMVKPNPEIREALSGAWKATKRAAQAGYQGVRAGATATAADWRASGPPAQQYTIIIPAEDQEYGERGTRLVKIGRKLFYEDKNGRVPAMAKRFGVNYHVDDPSGEVARIHKTRWKALWDEAKEKAIKPAAKKKNPAKGAAIGAGAGALLLGPLGAIAGGYLGSGSGKKKAKKPKRNSSFRRMMRL